MDLSSEDAELFIGLVARIGVDTKSLTDLIRTDLKLYRYEVEEIHVTDLLKAFTTPAALVEYPSDERYNSYIDACNQIRNDTTQDVLSQLAITEIVNRRGCENMQSELRKAYIINQIKRPEEFELFRRVYGEHYVQISCHADEQQRIARLTAKFTKDHPDEPKNPRWDIKARELTNKDESQEDQPSGQRVREVFPLSDVVIDGTTDASMKEGVERFLRALFGDKSVTPTREEYGMELANTAAQRSSDLSRQVGAAILTRQSEVRALGCNEVPSYGGGTYWEGDANDARDFKLGADSNEERKRAVLIDLVMRLKKVGALAEDLADAESIDSFLFTREDAVIKDSQIMDSLEYGRAVHAEMNAITDAARVGSAIRDCVLFSNTFPCHNCAKHIVASGITEVVYIKPFPKSYAKELFADSISVNPKSCLPDRVVFRQFVGIVGPMYSRVFTKARWKKNGVRVEKFVKSGATYTRATLSRPTQGLRCL